VSAPFTYFTLPDAQVLPETDISPKFFDFPGEPTSSVTADYDACSSACTDSHRFASRR